MYICMYVCIFIDADVSYAFVFLLLAKLARNLKSRLSEKYLLTTFILSTGAPQTVSNAVFNLKH